MNPRPTIEWQVCGICNYDCSYCIQSKYYRQGHPTPEQIGQFLSFFEKLPNPFEIKMTGGEPFAFHGFLRQIVPGLLERTGHTLSLLTNLSAPVSQIERFATLTRGRLGVVSASLHLEFTEPEAFVEKLRVLRQHMDPHARLTVNSVLVPGRLSQVVAARNILKEAGFTLFPQLMKLDGGIATYPETDQRLLTEIVGAAPTPDRANTAPSYFGRLCHAGVLYFVLLQNGDGYSCRTARRFKQGYLGNVFAENLHLWEEPKVCPYSICPCTTPANRAMIQGIGAGKQTEDT